MDQILCLRLIKLNRNKISWGRELEISFNLEKLVDIQYIMNTIVVFGALPLENL